MKSAIVAGLLVVPFLVPAHAQSVMKSHDLKSSAAAVRIKTLQNQVEKQQIEIDALRLRLGKLQDAFQELAEMIVDRNSDSDDDDSTDDADVTSLRVHSRSQKAIRHKAKTARPVTTVWTDERRPEDQSRRIH